MQGLMDGILLHLNQLSLRCVCVLIEGRALPEALLDAGWNSGFTELEDKWSSDQLIDATPAAFVISLKAGGANTPLWQQNKEKT